MKAYRYRKPHRFKKKKPIFRNRFFWLGILILILIISFSYFLFFSETFWVKEIIITGENGVSKKEIITFIPKKNIFLTDLGKIKEDILNNFPQIAEVEIKRGFPDTLNILVVERLGLAVWCQVDKCFLLDNEGIIFETALPETDLIKIIDEQNKVFTLGERVIEKEDLSKILDIETKLKSELRIPIKEFIITEEKLTVKTAENWEIYLNLKSDIEWQMTKLEVVLEEKIPPEKRENLEYIELRFGNLAPYKYKD
jgi:cell division septal protein FtsQ